jgi:hypothetical protein
MKELWQIINEMASGSLDGWGKAYYNVMPELIKKHNLRIGAEIGVAYGGHSDAMLKNTSVEALYSVDPYKPDWQGTDGYSLPDGQPFGKDEYEELYLHALHRLQKYGDRSKFIRLDSTAAWAKLKSEKVKLDFVFIDAKHTFEDLYTDIYLWEKVVRFGGIIAGHDYGHPSYPGVTQAVDYHFGARAFKHDGFVWSVKKTWI